MKNLATILFSPGETFERLRGKGGWVAAFITMLIVSLITVVLTMPLIERTARESLDQAREQLSVDGIMFITRITAYISGAAGYAATIFIGGVLLLLVNLIVRGEANYMQLVKVVIFSQVPNAICSLLVGMMALTMNVESIQDLTISAAAFFTEKKGFLYGLASMINPFTIWSLVLLIIGTSVMTRKPKSSVGIWIVLGWLVSALFVGFSTWLSSSVQV